MRKYKYTNVTNGTQIAPSVYYRTSATHNSSLPSRISRHPSIPFICHLATVSFRSMVLRFIPELGQWTVYKAVVKLFCCCSLPSPSPTSFPPVTLFWLCFVCVCPEFIVTMKYTWLWLKSPFEPACTLSQMPYWFDVLGILFSVFISPVASVASTLT